MVDITHKSTTLRRAVAVAVLKTSTPETIRAIKEDKVPKGNVLEAARTAGLFGVKRTWEMIPDCHPLPVEYTNISYELEEMQVTITMEVKTVYKTGVEVEAMHGVSVVALTMYDMLKPIDKGIEIMGIRLLEKSGGKSDYQKHFPNGLQACLALCSEPIASGNKEDDAGQAVIERLKKHNVNVAEYKISGQGEADVIGIFNAFKEQQPDLLIIAGGTGLSRGDQTPELIRPLLDKEIPGMMEAARTYGQNRTPQAMLSRGLAGMVGKTLVLVIPGSTRGAAETMDALMPYALHALIPMRKKF